MAKHSMRVAPWDRIPRPIVPLLRDSQTTRESCILRMVQSATTSTKMFKVVPNCIRNRRPHSKSTIL